MPFCQNCDAENTGGVAQKTEEKRLGYQLHFPDVHKFVIKIIYSLYNAVLNKYYGALFSRAYTTGI